MKLEGIRFLINSLDKNGPRFNRERSFDRTIRKIIYDIESAIDLSIPDSLEDIPVRLLKEPGGRSINFIEEKYNINGSPIRHAMFCLRDIVREMSEYPIQTSLFREEEKYSSDKLRKIVPKQKVSPIQFEFKEGILRISQRKSLTREEDRENIESAFGAIISQGEILIDNLKNSNCDKRLLENVEKLQKTIEEEGNIVKIGIMNVSCISLTAQFSEELPSAVLGMIKGYNASINLYISQFPEWEKFAENAAKIDLDEDDIASIADTAEHLAQALRNKAEEVDPEVPKSIIFLKAAALEPGKTSKRTAFALLRTIENLVAKIYDYSATFLDETIVSTSKKTASAISRAAAIALLTISISIATQLSQVSGKLGEMNWMNDATSILRRQIEKISSSE